MPLLESIASGLRGVHLRLPDEWSVEMNEEACAQLVDHERGVIWWLYAEPGLHLDLSDEHAQDLRNAAGHHAHTMFEFVHAQDEDNDDPPRTSDPDWSPMVDFERCELQGATVLRSTHRMLYRPGRETILGHLLIPRPWGLFEARVMATDTMTGMRESLQVDMALREHTGDGFPKIPQSVFDDPAFDDKMPSHCLSRSRAALRWLMHDSGLTIEPAELPEPAADVAVPEFGCTVRPPPRFFATDHPGLFRRTSFCVTDGIEQFFITKEDSTVSRFVRHATNASREIHEQSGVEDITLQVEQHSIREGAADVLVVIEGNGQQGRLRNVMLWRLDGQHRPWSLSLICPTAAVSREHLVEEILESGRSWTID